MVKDHTESERGNPLLPHGLLFPISSKGVKKGKSKMSLPVCLCGLMSSISCHYPRLG